MDRLPVESWTIGTGVLLRFHELHGQWLRKRHWLRKRWGVSVLLRLSLTRIGPAACFRYHDLIDGPLLLPKR